MIEYEIEDNFIFLRLDYDQFKERDIVKSLGGLFNKEHKYWYLPHTVYNMKILSEKLALGPNQTQLEKVKQREELENRLDTLKRMAIADEPVKFKIPGIKLPLYNYQKLGVLFALTNPTGMLLGDSMGLGKCGKWHTICYTPKGTMSIKEIFENHIQGTVDKVTSDGGEWFRAISDKPIEVLSKVGDRLAFQKVKGLYRERALKIGKLCLRDNSEVEAGLNHGYLTPQGWKHVKDLVANKDWIAVPSKIDVPDGKKINEDLIEILAWHIGEGFDGGGNLFSITQSDKSVLKDIKTKFDRLGFACSGNKHKVSHIEKDRDSLCLRICSQEFNEYLKKEFDYEHGYRSGNRIIPKRIQNCHQEGVRKFLRAYFDGEGCCNENNIELTSKSKELIESLRYMLRRFGILIITNPKVVVTQKGPQTYWKLIIGGKYVRIFKNEIGFGYQEKQVKLDKLCTKECNTNVGDSVPCRELLRELLDLTDLAPRRLCISGVYTSNKSIPQNPSKELVKKVVKSIDGILTKGLEIIDNKRWADRRNNSIKLFKKNRNRIIEIRNQLEFLSCDDITWLEVTDIEVTDIDEWLYDLEMEGEPNYVSDLALSHNTVQAIATACCKKQREGIKDCLIITPASLKWNWELEIKKFTDERYVIIDGTPQERLKQWLLDDVFFFVANYELIVEDLFGGRSYEIKEDDDIATAVRKANMQKKVSLRAQQLTPIRERVWGCCFLDECHYTKTHSAKRTRAVKLLKANYRMGLSGTPLDGRLEELHSVMQFVQPGLFESKTNFLAKYAIFDYWGNISGYKDIGIIRERIKPFFLRRLKKDVLKDLPDKVYQNRFVTLTKDEQKIYDDIADRAHEITEESAAMVAIIRAKQFCDHPELLDINSPSQSKLSEFLTILDELVVRNGQKVVIFSQYAKMCEILIESIKELKLKYLYICGDTDKKLRSDYQEMFNTDPSIDIMIGTDAMSLGLNFTGASYVINYDDFWSPSVMDQRSDRCHRLGQKNVVTVINFICKDTIEERIRDVLYSKAKISAEVLEDGTDEAVLKRLNPTEISKLL